MEKYRNYIKKYNSFFVKTEEFQKLKRASITTIDFYLNEVDLLNDAHQWVITEKANHLLSMWHIMTEILLICKSFRNHSSVNTNDKLRVILSSLEIFSKSLQQSKQSNDIRVKPVAKLTSWISLASLIQLENYFYNNLIVIEIV